MYIACPALLLLASHKSHLGFSFLRFHFTTAGEKHGEEACCE